MRRCWRDREFQLRVSKSPEELACFQDLLIAACKVPADDAGVYARADNLARVELHFEHP
jgi:hypothetical protein